VYLVNKDNQIMTKAKLPSPEMEQYIRDHYGYNEITGEVFRSESSQILRGELTKGYIRLHFYCKGAHYRAGAHRIAWLLHYGVFPPIEMQIDHINRERTDNRIANLRLATNGQNKANSSPRECSNYRGITFDAERSKWTASIQHNEKSIYLGRYQTQEEAARAYNHKAREIFGEFAYINDVPNPFGNIDKSRKRNTNNKTSSYLGVSFDKARSKWGATLGYKGQAFNLGRFDTEEEAAQARYLKLKEISEQEHNTNGDK
jgi:hypothetical protein